MRFATREGKYPRPRSNPPKITGALPQRAAAVMIHGADGSVATLCLDLDTSKASQTTVNADAAGIAELLTSLCLRFVADHSPSGGRHIYVPLTDRLAAEDARELVEALALRFTSLDPGPHQNVTDGCIRPPGSWHKTMSGHQELDTPLTEAYDIMRRRNPASLVTDLKRSLAATIHQLRAQKSESRLTAVAGGTGNKRKNVPTKASPLAQIARTGIYNKATYKSPSNARMAVLTHAVNTGTSFEQVRTGLTGQFAGLFSMFRNEQHCNRLLAFEYGKAQTWVDKNPGTTRPRKSSSLNNDTAPALTHSGGTSEVRSEASVMAEINDLENVLYAVLDQRLARQGREGISLRLLLRAVIGFARTKKSLVIDVGCRSFALEMGKHHATIARLLPRLEKLTEGLVERIELAHGFRADTYLLTLPQQYTETAKIYNWRKGKIHGVRPVFFAIGDVAALAYEAIERQQYPSSTADIVRSTGIGRTAVDQALSAMAELSMIERHHGYWRLVRTANLKNIAEALGVQEIYELQKLKVKKQRQIWQAHLERFLEPKISESDVYDEEKDNYEWGSGSTINPRAANPPDQVAA